MSLQIQLKKSAVTQKQPFASDLAVGELALNYNADGPFLTCKDTAGNVRKLNHVWVSATAPTGPSAGDLWLDTSATTAVLKVYRDSSATWVNATSIPLATTSVYGTVQLATSADITNGTSGKVVDAAQLQSKVTTEISSALAASPTTIQSLSVTNNAVVGGNLTVNGTTTTVNSETLLVKDKNIEMGVVTTPTDVTADGGGITLKGTTDKTINWVDATDSWTSSEHVDLASGKSYRINGTEVLSATALGSAVQISSANIPNGTIVDADVNASAEIAVSKLADGDARQLLQTDAAGTGVEWTSNVDVPGTLDVTGATTLDSTLTVPAGSAAAPTVRFTGDTNTGIYSPGADQLALSTNGTGRLFVDASGRVGIKRSPAQNIDVASSSNIAYAMDGWALAGKGDASDILLGGILSSQFDTLKLFTSGSERLRITSAGLVGIGTSAPSQLLDLSSSGNAIARINSGSANTAGVIIARGGTEVARVSSSVTDTLFLSTGSSATTRLTIDSSGRVGIGTTSPAYALDINSTSAAVRISNQGVSDILIANDATANTIYSRGATSSTAKSLRFTLGTAEAVRIDSSGRLLVGTSSGRGAHTFEGTTYNNSSVILATNQNSADMPFLQFVKSRGTTVGSVTAVQNGDYTGGIEFIGADGSTATAKTAAIYSQVDGTPGANDMPGRIVLSTTASGASSPTERLRITSTGRATGFTTNDNCLLLANSAVAGTSLALIYGLHTATAVTTGTISFAVYTNGDVQNTNNSYGAYSDVKLKENIVNASSQWDDLKALRVVNYNFKPETGAETHRQLGLIAQEVELVSPGLVRESPDRDAEGNDLGTVTKSVNYSVLYMKAVKALQEAMERIETLEAKVAALESA